MKNLLTKFFTHHFSLYKYNHYEKTAYQQSMYSSYLFLGITLLFCVNDLSPH